MDDKPKAKITIANQYATLTGDFPVLEVREVCSYPVSGAEWSDAYRRGLWDGRSHLFNAKTGKFGAGLVPVVKALLTKEGVECDVEDARETFTPRNSYGPMDAMMEGKFSYQRAACDAMMFGKQGILSAATNSGKTNICIAVAYNWNVSTLFVVSSRELLYQGQKRFMKVLGLTEKEIGIVGDGHWSPGSWITIAIMDTLEARLETAPCKKLLAKTKLLIVDECQYAGSETWFTVLEKCPAPLRYGVSGTALDRTDGADMRLISLTGDVLYRITNKELIDLGVSAKTDVIWDRVSTPVLKPKSKYPTVYKLGIVENEQLLEKVVEWTKIFYEEGLSVLILSEEIAQGKRIDEALWNKTGGVFIPHQYISGTEEGKVRAAALDDFGSRALPVLLASSILDVGVDVPTVDALICAGSRKSRIKTMQRIGRGLRGQKLIVVDFANYTHKFLLEHSLVRYNDIEQENCFTIHQSGPNADLVKKIWHTVDNK